MNRFLNFFLTFCILVSIVVGFPMFASAMTRSEFDSKLSILKQTYYHGLQKSSYEEGTTCFGYAYMIAKSVFGSSAGTWTKSYDLASVKAGDVVQYGNTSGSGHTIFVTNVSGDTITYTDCNSDYQSTIKWNQTVSKNKNLYYSFNYRLIAPNLEDQSNSNADIGDDYYGYISSPYYVGMYLTSDGNNVFLKKFTGEDGQIWHFSRSANLDYRLESFLDGQCMDLCCMNSDSNIWVYPDNGTDAQRWIFIKNSDGYYTIKSKAIKGAMDISGYGNDYDNIQIYEENHTNNQIFAVEKTYNNISTSTSAFRDCKTEYDNNNGVKLNWTRTCYTKNFTLTVEVLQNDSFSMYNTYTVEENSYSFILPVGNYRAKVTSNTGYSAISSDYTYFNVIDTNDYNLYIQPNGGTWNGSAASNQVFSQKYGTTKAISDPVRSGYTFVGWNLDYSGTDHKLEPYGVPLLADPSFNNVGTLEVYNQRNNDTVDISKVTKDNSFAMSSAYMMEITTAGAASPGLGGFLHQTYSKANGVFYHVISAKIPVGYKIHDASNSSGDGATVSWLTPRDGTGNWETYIYKKTCGATGTFSDFGYCYLEGTAATAASPVTWYVGYSEIFDATGVNQSGKNYTFGNGVAYLYAQWSTAKAYTESTVSKTSTGCSININLYNIPELSKIIVAGYNDKKFVTMQTTGYTKASETIELTGDIDNVKVMVWSSIGALMPLTDVEEIPSSMWIAE